MDHRNLSKVRGMSRSRSSVARDWIDIKVGGHCRLVIWGNIRFKGLLLLITWRLYWREGNLMKMVHRVIIFRWNIKFLRRKCILRWGILPIMILLPQGQIFTIILTIKTHLKSICLTLTLSVNLLPIIFNIQLIIWC